MKRRDKTKGKTSGFQGDKLWEGKHMGETNGAVFVLVHFSANIFCLQWS